MRKYRAGNAARDLFDGCVRNDVYIIEINTQREMCMFESVKGPARMFVAQISFIRKKKREKKIERERERERERGNQRAIVDQRAGARARVFARLRINKIPGRQADDFAMCARRFRALNEEEFLEPIPRGARSFLNYSRKSPPGTCGRFRFPGHVRSYLIKEDEGSVTLASS